VEFIYALGLAFKDLKESKIQKLSVFLGSVWAVFWIVVTVFLWKNGLEITNFLISLIPFTFLQKAGTQFIEIIVLFQLVLATLGIVYSLFNKVFKNIYSSLILVVVIAFFWFGIFFVYHNEINIFIKNLLKIFPFQSIEDVVSNALLAFVFYSFYIASFYFSFIIFSSEILEEIKEDMYPDISIDKHFNILKIIFINIRDFMMFLIGIILFYPLMFIPFLNIFIIWFLWAFLIKESLINSVFMITGKEELNKKEIWAFSLVSVVFNFMPVINFYAPAIGILSIFHYIMEKKTEKEGTD